MSLDSKVAEAIRDSVENCGQPPALARKIIAWLEAVASESEDINDVAAADRHLEVIYEEVAIGDDVDEGPADAAEAG